MTMDHSKAPVLAALASYHAAGRLAFTPPGHRQGRGADPRVREILGEGVFRSDVLAVAGLDDRTSSGRVLEQAEALMADAVHADHTFFSTCGNSLSVKAAMLAVAGPHQKLLVSRDAHKAVVAGLVLAGIRPVWVEPQWDPGLHLAHPPAPESYEAVFEAHPDARGALVTSPTPYGTTADLAAIAEVCHRRDLPLVVDEAWGAHLPFHPALPTWAMDAGADLCVTSVHKSGSGFEQGSVFHLRGDRVSRATLAARADLLGTTSPSVLLHAGMDGWRRQMVEDGEELLGMALSLAERVRAILSRVEGLHVHGRADFCGPGRGHDMDPLQVVADVSALGMTGYQAADWLREHHRIDLHLCDHRRIGAQLSHADNDATARRLIDGLRDLSRSAGRIGVTEPVLVPSPGELRLEQAMLPRDAFFGPVETVPCDRAAGRIAAETLTPYPPGIPAALPGERLNSAVVDYLCSGVAAGMVVPDAADPEVKTFRVVADG